MLEPEASVEADWNLTENDLTPQLPEGKKESGLDNPIKISRRTLFRTALGVGGLLTVGAIERNYTQAAKIFFPDSKGNINSPEVTVQQIPNPIEFDYAGSHWELEILNGDHGTPPNPVGTRMDSVYPTKDGVWLPKFQGYRALYPEASAGPGVAVVIFGLVVDTSTGKLYMATGLNINNVGYPRLEIIAHVNNPYVYTTEERRVIKGGLAQEGTNGDSYKYMILGNDADGKYIDVGIQYAINSTQDGRHRIRLDNSGNPIEPFIKVEHKILLPLILKNSAQ